MAPAIGSEAEGRVRVGIGPVEDVLVPNPGASWRSSLAFLGLTLASCTPAAPPEPPPLRIPVIVTRPRDLTIPIEVVGETIGSTEVKIRPRVEGYLESIHFPEGYAVEAGELLYTIDPRPFEQRRVQARGEEASANTALVKAESDLARIRPLAEMNAVSQQELDAAVAQVDAARSSLDVARAQVQLAEIELGYTKIEAPIAGLIGLSQADVGDFVGQIGSSPLNTISTIDPIGVRMTFSERAYLAWAQSRPPETARDPEGPELTLVLSDRNVYPHRGRPTKLDSRIDPTTGTLTVEAEFPNPDRILRPGMFARVRLTGNELEGAIVVPQRAVAELQGRFRVFVISASNTVEARPVTPGPRIGSEWVIESGLTAGERIAVEGLIRLRPGMKVSAVPYSSPSPNAGG